MQCVPPSRKTYPCQKKRSELTSDSELQQSAEHNVWTKQEWSKSGLEETAWHGALWVVTFARYISEKIKGNSDDRGGTHRKHRKKNINVGSLSHDFTRKRITRGTEVRNFRAFYVQYQHCTKRLSLVLIHKGISVRPETGVWSRRKTRTTGLAERFWRRPFLKKAYISSSHNKKRSLIYMANKWRSSLLLVPTCWNKKRNVYLPSLRMKVPDLVFVLGHSYTWSGTFILKDGRFKFFYSTFFCFSANSVSVEVETYSSNLRFNLYWLLYSAFFYFLTASMSISAILVTRCAFTTIL
jgi:hypothetical protein